MTTVWLCIGVAILAFLFGVAGLYLQKLLPEPHSVDLSRDMIGAIVGLVSLLLALVLGTLIGSAYSFFSTQKSELETLAAREVQLDLALAEFGPETQAARARMKQMLEGVRAMLWGDGGADSVSELSTAAPHRAFATLGLVHRLARPEDAGATAIRGRSGGGCGRDRADACAHIDAIGEFDLLASGHHCRLVGADPFLRLWPALPHQRHHACGVGPSARFAVGSALFMILELSHPFTGVFRVPSGAFDQMLALIGQ